MKVNPISGGKAELKDGVISAFIYDQEGTLQPLKVKDTLMNRCFIQWLQRHDRYSNER